MSSLINSQGTGLYPPRDASVPFCITRKVCKKNFCICNLLDLDLRAVNPRRVFTTLIICDNCYRELYNEYKIFAAKVKNLRYDFMDSYIAVKIYLMLNKIKREIVNNSCECRRTDCNCKNLSMEERNVIKEKFDLMHNVFGTPDGV